MSPQLEAIERAIVDTERAGEEYAGAARFESVLQAGRHGVKQEAVKRILESGAATSISAAEKLVETDPEYAAHLEAERQSTFQKNMAYTRLIAARLRALGRIIEVVTANPSPLTNLLAGEVDLDLVRSRDDAREQLVGGVPQ